MSVHQLAEMAGKMGITNEMLRQCGHHLHKSTYACAIRLAQQLYKLMSYSDNSEIERNGALLKRSLLQCQQMKKEYDKMKKESVSNEYKIAELNQEVRSLKFEMQHQKAEIVDNQSPLESQVEDLKREFRQSNASLAEFRKRVQEITQEKCDMAKEYSALNNQYKHISEINKDLSNDLQQAEKESKVIAAQLASYIENFQADCDQECERLIEIACREQSVGRKRALQPDEWSNKDIIEQYKKRQKLAEVWINNPRPE